MSVYTSALTAQDTSAQTLTVNEQYALITDVQNVPTTVEILEDGSEYVTYGVTPASEAAGAKLLAAFWPAIIGAARTTKLRNNEDDAEAIALEAFVRCVREFDLTGDTPFHHIVPNVMRRAVKAADRAESTPLNIPDAVVKRYWRVYNEHGQDIAAAAESVRADVELPWNSRKWLIESVEALLTIHVAMHDTASLNAPAGDGIEGIPLVESTEDRVVREDYVRWLLAQTTDRQESVCRLAYGFTDAASDAARLDHGYREGDVLDDSQVADCLDMSRPTVQRERDKALKTMRAAAEAAIAGEEA